jgi:hypothetical protein
VNSTRQTLTLYYTLFFSFEGLREDKGMIVPNKHFLSYLAVTLDKESADVLDATLLFSKSLKYIS